MLVHWASSLVFAASLMASEALPSKESLARVAFSEEWLRLYVYEKKSTGYVSKATEAPFFFSQRGREDPLAELQAAIQAFRSPETRWGHIQMTAQCAFPARYARLKQHWPGLFEDVPCPALQDWLQRIGARKISLVFAGSYPNNPASMFGHTLVRLHKEGKSELLDYNVAFRAAVDSSDDPVAYTVKGITGGYLGFYEIKPYYENLGQYTNSESRDLWEYELNLSPAQVEFFTKHLWEVSQNTGFRYFFLDENCSYFLITLLEAAVPDKELHLTTDLLIHPIETIKEAVRQIGSAKRRPAYRPSLDRRLKHRLKKMTGQQKVEFERALKGEGSEDPLVLDAAIAYWKGKFYRKQGQLSQAEQSLMSAIFLKRAQNPTSTRGTNLTSEISPIEVHRPRKFQLGQSLNKGSIIGLSWGYHSLMDSEIGLTRWGFIDYFSLDLSLEGEPRIQNWELFNIYAFENFGRHNLSPSWHAVVDSGVCAGCGDISAELGGGIASHKRQFIHWVFLLGRLSDSDGRASARIGMEYGLKWQYRSNIFSTQIRQGLSESTTWIFRDRIYLYREHAIDLQLIADRDPKGRVAWVSHF